jgi:hypothetical protein
MFVEQINILTLPLIISSAKQKITEIVKFLHKMTKIATYLGHFCVTSTERTDGDDSIRFFISFNNFRCLG